MVPFKISDFKHIIHPILHRFAQQVHLFTQRIYGLCSDSNLGYNNMKIHPVRLGLLNDQTFIASMPFSKIMLT